MQFTVQFPIFSGTFISLMIEEYRMDRAVDYMIDIFLIRTTPDAKSGMCNIT